MLFNRQNKSAMECNWYYTNQNNAGDILSSFKVKVRKMKEMIVKDFMNTNFAKISEEMPAITASIELIKKEVLGGPVVDKENKLLGWISEQECLQVTTQYAYHNHRVALVKDIMREDVLSIKKDQSIFSLAEKMLGTQPKNYPVVDDNNKVIGVISRRRVLKALLDNHF